METNYEKVKNISTEEYFKNNEFAVDMFSNKYTLNKEETPAKVFNRIAFNLSLFEKEENQKHYSDIWFSLMWNDWFRTGGSIMSGIGSDRNESLLNCTTVPIEADSLEAISDTYYSLMKCAAYRQGIGVDLSSLRPRGSKVSNAAQESTGIVPWGTKFSNVGVYVGQRGRIPALLLSLLISHPDIEEFITAKEKSGQIENANISIQITDDFMECLENNKMWKLYFKTEKETIEKEIDPNYLIDLISEKATMSAEPGIQFIDSMKQGSMIHPIYLKNNDDRYKIISSNACSEKPLPKFGCCNLGSLNMEKFSTTNYKKELKEIIPYLVRLLDNVVQYELDNNKSPLEQQKYILEKTREIGLGITNVHGWLLKQDLQYDSDEAIEKVEDFWKYYAYYVFNTSIELAKEKGNAPAFELIDSKDLYKNSLYFKNIVDEFYNKDYNKVTNMRNMAHLSIAPTGSISQSFSIPCISSGIEPIIGPYYWRRTRAISKGSYNYYFVISNRVKDYILSQIPKENIEDYEKINSFPGSEKDNDGKIGKELIEIINKHISKSFFKPAHEIDYNKKIKLMSKIYKWIDASISCTFNLPVTATKEDIRNIYINSYKKGLRAVSVYREGSREGILIFEDPITHKNKYDNKNLLCLERPENIVYHCAPKRPKELNCEIHHCSVKGEKWLVVIGLLDNKPYELFAGQQEYLYLPKSVKEGVIKKNGKSKYSLVVNIRKNEVEYKDITNVLMSSEQKALTRMISLSLRHGSPIEFVTTQLKKAKEDITDFSSAVSRVLSKYETDDLLKGEKCPSCGEPMMKIEGCLKCINEKCDYSRCE